MRSQPEERVRSLTRKWPTVDLKLQRVSGGRGSVVVVDDIVVAVVVVVDIIIAVVIIIVIMIDNRLHAA